MFQRPRNIFPGGTSLKFRAVDEQLQEQLRARRCREAFESIVREFGQRVFRLAYSYLGDEALAEDAAQEVFLRVWRALPHFQGRSSISTWIYAITRNLCLTRVARRASEELRRPRLEPASKPCFGHAPATYDLEQALAQLPAHYRQALVLFYFEGKSYEAAAELLGLPVGTLKTHLHRARKLLRAALEEQYGKPIELRRV